MLLSEGQMSNYRGAALMIDALTPAKQWLADKDYDADCNLVQPISINRVRPGGVNKKRVERIWRCEGLKVSVRRPKRGCLWPNDSSCIHLRPERPNHVWSYDFVADRTHDGKALRILCIIDEFSRESLTTRVARKLKATDVIEALCEMFVSRGIPAYIRSDNGPEFVAEALWDWIATVGAKTAYTQPGCPWENGYCESFNGKLRDELLNGEIFYTLKKAQIVIENWRRHYNTVRPHSSLGYRPPAPEALVWPAPKEIEKCNP